VILRSLKRLSYIHHTPGQAIYALAPDGPEAWRTRMSRTACSPFCLLSLAGWMFSENYAKREEEGRKPDVRGRIRRSSMRSCSCRGLYIVDQRTSRESTRRVTGLLVTNSQWEMVGYTCILSNLRPLTFPAIRSHRTDIAGGDPAQVEHWTCRHHRLVPGSGQEGHWTRLPVFDRSV